MKSYIFIIEGKVHNVGFRYFTLQQALSLNIKGYVCNKNDGSVEVSASGKEEDMLRFINQIKKGPSSARVTTFTINELPFEVYETFTIKH